MGTKSQSREVIHYVLRSPKIREKVTFSVVSDLHDGNFDNVTELLLSTDAILVPGDLVNRYTSGYSNALRFLNEMKGKIPVFYSFGNHERRNQKRTEYEVFLPDTGATIINDTSCVFKGITIGGLSSKGEGRCDMDFVGRFEQTDGYKILLCHHPEVFENHIKDKDIDLVLCGHAHGGQMQFFGKGLYAPGQGLFPKLTHGMYAGGQMILSRGMTNSTFLPRINNPCELLIVTLIPSML